MEVVVGGSRQHGGNLTPNVWALNEIQFISNAIYPATLREEGDWSVLKPAQLAAPLEDT